MSYRSNFRKPTSQAYGLKPTFTSAPKHQEEEENKLVEDVVPSYKFADKQKGAIDTEAEKRDHEDEEIREKFGKNPDDVEQPVVKFKPKTKTVVKNDKSDQPSTEASHGAFAFEAFWSREVDYDLEEVTHTIKNTWTPNAWGMFEILDAASIFVTESHLIAKHHARYLDYAVACYYSIMFYIQILRAQLAAGIISGQDSSFLRRFDRKFKPEELPVTCLLVPFFSSITSCLLPDSKYSWISPAVADGIFAATMAGQAHANHAATLERGGKYLQPMVPYMLSILRTVITQARQNALTNTMAQTDNGDAGNNDLKYFNDRDEYIPGRISDNVDTNLFGLVIRNGQARNDGRNTLFSWCGVSYPFHANYDTLNNAIPKWRQSSFATLRENNLADGTRAINDLEHFLHMEKEDDMEWFRELILQAGIHARFFGESQTFSDIPTTGGLETLITALHKKPNVAGAGNHHFADVDIGTGTLANGTEPWYPMTFRRTVASFYTTRNGYKRQEVLQAMSFAVNATIYVGVGPNRVGEDAAHYRKGPYWQNKEWTATRFAEAAQLGKPMFAGWRELIQTNFAKIKPQGY